MTSVPGIVDPSTFGMRRSAVALWCFIAGYAETNQIMPTFREMAAGTDVRSISKISPALAQLEAHGLIRRMRHRERAIDMLVWPNVPRAGDGAPLHFISVSGLPDHGVNNG